MSDMSEQFNFNIIIPELALTLIALFTQFFAVFLRNKYKVIASSTIFLTIFVYFTLPISGSEIIGFNDSFANNSVVNIYKILVLTLSVMSLISYYDYSYITNEEFKQEFFTLTLLSTVGIFIAISARNFLLLFSSTELTALIGYVLAGFKLNDIKSSEGALKYFILGSLVSCLSLFGISFIYGFGGSLDFTHISDKLNNQEVNIGLIIGIILFLSSLFFKLSVVPLHSWTADVYQGSPITSVIYFATSTKVGIVAVLINIVTLVTIHYYPISINLIKIAAILSMIFGALGAIRQTSLKRLMAYSTILNIGYVLIGIAINSDDGNNAAMIYMFIYAISTIGFFTFLITLLGQDVDNADFTDIEAIGESNKVIAGAITIIMFSMIGIPPLAGFFGKYYLFYQAINKEEYLLAFIAIATSVIAAYYYLKVIKTMYFTEKNPNVISPVSIEDIKKTPIGISIINLIVIGFIICASFVTDIVN